MRGLLALQSASLLFSVAFVASAPVYADSYSIADLGSVYTVKDLGPGSGTHDYIISVTIDTSGFNNGSGPVIVTDRVEAVAINVNATIIKVAPLLVPPNPINWTAQLGGTNSGGCDGTGKPFACAQANSVADSLATGNLTPYTFQFDITLGAGSTPDFGTLADHIKVVYTDSFGNFVNQISDNITLEPRNTPPVPEPTSILLLGTALIFAGKLMKSQL